MEIQIVKYIIYFESFVFLFTLEDRDFCRHKIGLQLFFCALHEVSSQMCFKITYILAKDVIVLWYVASICLWIQLWLLYEMEDNLGYTLMEFQAFY